MKNIDVAGLKISAITKQELLEKILDRAKAGEKTFITTPYSEFLYQEMTDLSLLEFLNKADFAVPDGIGIFWAKKFLDIPLTTKNYWVRILQCLWQVKYSLFAIIFYPKWVRSAFPEKIVGADLVWDLAKLAAENNYSIYLLGGYGNTAELCGYKLQTTNYQLSIAGSSSKDPSDTTIIDDINSSQADFLFVAYGPIKQEKWIADNLEKLNVKMAIGVGGSFDYISGAQKSPPKFIRSIGLEWLWRLCTQPYRAKRIWQATFGLANRLVHYKVLSGQGLRPNVVVVILNKENKVLVCNRNPNDAMIDVMTSKEVIHRGDYWQFPQGGADKNEDLVQTAKREAMEETSLTNLSYIKTSAQTHSYYWNNAVRDLLPYSETKTFSGQKQNILYFKYSGSDTDVKVDNHEFIDYQWVTISEIHKIIHTERSGITKIVQTDLA